MSGFPIADLVIGMIFIYFLLSVICSSLVEIVQTIAKARAKIMYAWLMKLFDKNIVLSPLTTTTLGQAIMDHCAAMAMSDPKKAPSYIDRENFTTALIDLLTLNPASPGAVTTSMVQLKSALQSTTALSDEMKRTLLTFANDASQTYMLALRKTDSEITLFRNKVEHWYDTNMDRLAGTLKRRWSGWLTCLFAATITIYGNADTIAIAQHLYSNPEVRMQAARLGIELTRDSSFIRQYALKQNIPDSTKDTAQIATVQAFQNRLDSSIQRIRQSEATLDGLIPLGWPGKISQSLTPMKVLGLLLTILAIMLGAPFWFDILNKVANLRGTGPKPASSTGGDFNKPGGKKGN